MILDQIILRNKWQFAEVDKLPLSGIGELITPAWRRKFNRAKWRAAQVPGHVHLDLLSHGLIPDPFLETNEAKVQWVEERDWAYRATIEIDPASAMECRALDLVFDGLDTIADIYFDGLLLGRADNMFRQWRFDVKNVVEKNASRTHELLVLFHSSKKIGDSLEKAHGACRPRGNYRAQLRRAQYLTGWDWGPRLSGVGVWRDVYMERVGAARINSPWIEIKNATKASAGIVFRADVNALEPGRYTIRFELRERGKSKLAAIVENNVRVDKYETREIKISHQLKRPRLWWPAWLKGNGFTLAELYDVEVVLTAPDGKVIDTKKFSTGIRTAKLIQEPDKDGKNFIIEINGEKIFCRGANWIPADPFPARVKLIDYAARLNDLIQSGGNCLRVWGGGIYESPDFYDLCDEQGIIVWQDFMYACGDYPDYPEFLENAQVEARQAVRRLRRHPSIALWCGNNENEWLVGKNWRNMRGIEIWRDLLPRVCAMEDGSRAYVQSSPFGGDDPNSPTEGDAHNWSVWHGLTPPAAYTRDTSRFVSEFGFQSLPDLNTIAAFTNERDITLRSPALRSHNKMDHGGNVRLWSYLHLLQPLPRNFDEIVYLTQLNQAEAMKTGVEHWRRRKFNTSGALIWQLNDCWPVSSWAMVDYLGFPKAVWYFAQRFFAPRMISIEPLHDVALDSTPSVCIVNDELKGFRTTVKISLLNMNGSKVKSWSRVMRVPGNDAINVKGIPVEIFTAWRNAPFDTIFHVCLLNTDGNCISQNAAFAEEAFRLNWQSPKLKTTVKRVSEYAFSVRVKTTSYARCVAFSLDLSDMIESVGRPVEMGNFAEGIRWVNNFVDILPEEESEFICMVDERIKTLKDFKNRLRILCLNDIAISGK